MTTIVDEGPQSFILRAEPLKVEKCACETRILARSGGFIVTFGGTLKKHSRYIKMIVNYIKWWQVPSMNGNNNIIYVPAPVYPGPLQRCLLLSNSCLPSGRSILLSKARPLSQSRTFVNPKDRRKTVASWKITIWLIGSPRERVRCLQVPGIPAELLILSSWSFLFSVFGFVLLLFLKKSLLNFQFSIVSLGTWQLKSNMRCFTHRLPVVLSEDRNSDSAADVGARWDPGMKYLYLIHEWYMRFCKLNLNTVYGAVAGSVVVVSNTVGLQGL